MSDSCETDDDNSEAENYDFHIDKWDRTPTDKDETEGHEGVGYSNDFKHTP